MSASGRYCQLGKRFLDGFGWIAPVTNNRLGDALNIEFVHEQLFLIDGDQVLKDVGYSEKGKRFSEGDMGKPIRTLEDLERNGYWLVGRRYHPEAALEALDTLDDGYYYSFFSNQCQDWADRLRKRIESIEREKGMPRIEGGVDDGSDARFWREKPPTVPGSVGLALFAILLGVGSFLAPAVAAHRSIWVLAAFLIVSGVADVLYALHGRVWSQIVGICFFATLNLLAGGALLLETGSAAKWAGGIFGMALAIHGAARIVVGLRSRPIRRHLGSILEGVGLLVGALVLLSGVKGDREVLFGWIVGFNLLLGGFSTLWLHWTVGHEKVAGTPGGNYSAGTNSDKRR